MKISYILILTGFMVINLPGLTDLINKNDKSVITSLNYNDILVGTKLNDSMAQISVSNSSIQTSIIPQLKVLTNAVISSELAVISQESQINYLVFSATAVTSKQIVVAIELTRIDNNLFFKNIAGKQVHVWESRGNCLSCKFVQDFKKNRMNCLCNSPVKESNDEAGGCDHFMFFIP